MAWAIFHRRFDFDFRPKRAVCITIRPSDVPQQLPERVVAAAVKAGAARRTESPTAEEARQYKRSKRTRKPRST